MGPAWQSRHHISLTAVLEFGPTEILPPIGAISKNPSVSADPIAKPAAQTRAESRVLDLRKRLRERDRLSAGGSWIRTSGSASCNRFGNSLANRRTTVIEQPRLQGPVALRRRVVRGRTARSTRWPKPACRQPSDKVIKASEEHGLRVHGQAPSCGGEGRALSAWTLDYASAA